LRLLTGIDRIGWNTRYMVLQFCQDNSRTISICSPSLDWRWTRLIRDIVEKSPFRPDSTRFDTIPSTTGRSIVSCTLLTVNGEYRVSGNDEMESPRSSSTSSSLCSPRETGRYFLIRCSSYAMTHFGAPPASRTIPSSPSHDRHLEDGWDPIA
jgi:hypothetical protein